MPFFWLLANWFNADVLQGFLKRACMFVFECADFFWCGNTIIVFCVYVFRGTLAFKTCINCCIHAQKALAVFVLM